MATFLLEVVTPEKTVIKEDVDMVICPGTEGEFGVLPHHISLLSALKIGALRYRQGDKDTTCFVSGGFVDVNNNKCSVLAEAAEKTEDIDRARAQAAKERAEARLAAREANLDEDRAQIALQKAIMRLAISSSS